MQRVASLGRAARSNAGIKVRQPLAAVSVAVPTAADSEAIQRHAETIAEELNVKEVRLAEAGSGARRYTIKPNLRVLGPRLGGQLPALRGALGALAPELAAHIAQAVESGKSVEVEGVSLTRGDLLIESEAGGGADSASAEDDLCSVSLDTNISEPLAQEGLAREVIHRVQSLRRESGLDPADRIRLALETEDAALGAALRAFEGLIAAETLATELAHGGAGHAHEVSESIEGAPLRLSLTRV